jgi:hypothetical protein
MSLNEFLRSSHLTAPSVDTARRRDVPTAVPTAMSAGWRRVRRSAGMGILPCDGSERARPTGIPVLTCEEDLVSVSDRYWLTIAEAATATGVSRDSIRRRLRAGGFPGARRRPSSSGAWHIPVRDLTDSEWAVDLREVETVIAERTAGPAGPAGPAALGASEAVGNGAVDDLADLVATQSRVIQGLLSARCTCGGAR